MKYTVLFNPIVVMFHGAFPPYLTESPPLTENESELETLGGGSINMRGLNEKFLQNEKTFDFKF